MTRTESTADAASTDDNPPPDESGADERPDDAEEPFEWGPLTPESWRRQLHDERAIRKVSTVVFGGLSVIIVLALISLLPGLDGAEQTFSALASGVMGISIAAVLGYVALVLPWYVRTTFDGPRDLREPGVTAGVWTLVLAAVLTLHRGFAPLFEVTNGPVWLYDGLFLLVAVVPLAMVALALWRTIDPVASYLSARFADTR